MSLRNRLDLDLSLALCICPEELADEIIKQLLNENIAFCIDKLPSCEGFYNWLDDYKLDNQAILLITIVDDLSEELYASILNLDFKEMPIIVMIGIDRSYPEYVEWLIQRMEQNISDSSYEENSFPNLQQTKTEEQNEHQNIESKGLEQLKQELKSNKQKLTELKTQLKKVEERIENARRTNIFGRPQSGENERERDKLTQEIKDTKNRIAQNESAIKALGE